ncbi:MAG: GspE/PulE family protein, partial [bacterium]|nr:GspE/PulE family protein [bacterium]
NARQTLSDIGLLEDSRLLVENMLKNSYGMILLTGPTGSGKTTTLYSALNHIHTPDKNIVTVEDPVEFRVEGLSQVAVNPKIGLTFSHVLRAVVRQDPDIIMVGEIRDYDTADISIRAALTGHLVLSSLHTNDAPSTITRLMEMGVEPYLIASSLIGIIAQRLVRKLCPNCRRLQKIAGNSSKGIALELDLALEYEFYFPTGCSLCGNEGYRGRVGIFEILPVHEDIKELITLRAPLSEIRKLARDSGSRSLLEDGLLKAKSGLTSLDEVLRVAYQEG